MKLIFVRHGQSNYNLKNLCNGRPSNKVYLTALGKKQARQAAKKLAKSKIDVIFISQLRRSKQTANIINRFHKVPLIVDKRLNDLQVGIFEGRSASLFDAWRSHQKNPWIRRPRGGESYEDLKKRFRLFLKDLVKKDYKTVLIVSHLPVLQVARGYFKKLTNAAMVKQTDKEIVNCKIMRFVIKK